MNNIVSLLKLSESIDQKLIENQFADLFLKKQELDKQFLEKENESPYLIRYLMIVLDCSKSMKNNDYKPSRFKVTVNALEVSHILK